MSHPAGHSNKQIGAEISYISYSKAPFIFKSVFGAVPLLAMNMHTHRKPNKPDQRVSVAF